MNAGWVSLIALYTVFLLMSIMFPTIFAIGDQGSWSANQEGGFNYCDGHSWRSGIPTVYGAYIRFLFNVHRFSGADSAFYVYPVLCDEGASCQTIIF